MAVAAVYKVSKTLATCAAKNLAKMVYNVIKEEYTEAMTTVPGQWMALKQAKDACACARCGITCATLKQKGASSDDGSVSVPMGEHLLGGPMACLPLISGTSTSTSCSQAQEQRARLHLATPKVCLYLVSSCFLLNCVHRQQVSYKEAAMGTIPIQGGPQACITMSSGCWSHQPHSGRHIAYSAVAKVSALSWPLALHSVFGLSSTSGSKGKITHISTSNPIQAIEI